MKSTEDYIMRRLRETTVAFNVFKSNSSFKNRKVRLRVFEKYVTVMHPHFIVWVSAMQNSCVTPIGKYAAMDNVLVELSEDHQKMLFNFTGQFGVYPNVKVYQEALPMIDTINEIVILRSIKTFNGAGVSIIIYALEQLSQDFLVWMHDAAIQEFKDSGNKVDVTYIEKHGHADIKHANLAKQAVLAEIVLLSKTDQVKTVNNAMDAVDTLMRFIFS